jgi:hypothetical protein
VEEVVGVKSACGVEHRGRIRLDDLIAGRELPLQLKIAYQMVILAVPDLSKTSRLLIWSIGKSKW